MKILKSRGTSIIFITHKLREVRAVADKITIIRLGKVVGTQLPSASQEELANLMVGREVDLAPNKAAFNPGGNVLEINDLSIFNDSGRKVVSNLSLNIRAGEILAIAGVQGNGQSELARAIVNLEKHKSGSIKLDGKEILGSTVRDSLRAGIAYIPEENLLSLAVQQLPHLLLPHQQMCWWASLYFVTLPLICQKIEHDRLGHRP